jgi:hypothetical protein
LHTNIIVSAGDIVIPDKTSKQAHTFRSVALNRRGSFEVEIYASNKREPVYTRTLSSANITWNIGCIELPHFNKTNIGESISVDVKFGYAHRDVSARPESGETVNCCIDL